MTFNEWLKIKKEKEKYNDLRIFKNSVEIKKTAHSGGCNAFVFSDGRTWGICKGNSTSIELGYKNDFSIGRLYEAIDFLNL